MPNDDYEITGYSLAASGAYPDNSGGESLAHIDLDRDYQAGQTFEVGLSITEKRLFYAEGGNYKLDFSPGWYDRAAIDSLQVRVAPPGGTSTATADPAPSSKSDQEFVWTWSALSPGQRLSISVALPKTSLAIADPNLAQPGSTGQAGAPIDSGFAAAAVFFFLVVLVYALSVLRLKKMGGYTDGDVYSGGHGIVGTGRACYCACACACAGCACAGGGGAGCSRKMEARWLPSPF